MMRGIHGRFWPSFLFVFYMKALSVNAYIHSKIRLIMTLRQSGITDTQTLSAIERTPREIFVSETYEDQAYDNIALPIGLGQTISQPFVVAKMTEALNVHERDKVLEIGTGSGYQASVLARMCRRLYTIERHPPLSQMAESRFAEQGLSNITAMTGDGMKGWGIQAPFDKIIVTAGALKEPPHALFEQLKVGGIMVVPVGEMTLTQVLKRYEKLDEETYSVIDICPVRFVPLLPDVARVNDYYEDDMMEIAKA